MFSTKKILIFGVKCIGIYLVLLLAGIHLGFGNIYRNIVIAQGNRMYRKMSQNAKAEFYKNDNPILDTKITVRNRKVKRSSPGEFSTWYLGYLPSILFISLLLATPLSDRKKQLLTLLLGIFITNLLLWAMIRLRISYYLMFMDFKFGVVENETYFKTIKFLFKTTGKNISQYTIFPIFVWASIVAYLNSKKTSS